MAMLRQSSALTSYVELTHPFVDPTGTFRASSVGQMYSVVYSPGDWKFRYDVGLTNQEGPWTIRFRNNCQSHSLTVSMTVPAFVIVTPLTVTSDWYVPEGQTIDFSVKLNNDFMSNRVKEALYNAQTGIELNVVPNNVAGPVFVFRDLPPLSL